MDKIELVQTKDIAKIYQDITRQFPLQERKSFDCFKKLAEKENYKVYYAVINNEKTGYAAMLFNSANKTFWLDYVAVFEEFHSKGYGGMILEAFKDFNVKEGYKGCWLEVEKPDENVPNTIRRIKFYEKAGAVRIDCNYLYPNEEGCLPMELYFLPLEKGFSPSCELRNESIAFTFNSLHCELPHSDEILSCIINSSIPPTK